MKNKLMDSLCKTIANLNLSVASVAATLEVDKELQEALVKAVNSKKPVVDFSKLTLVLLKEACKERGLPQNGKKDELVDRLTKFVNVKSPVKDDSPVNYTAMKVADLTKLCAEYNLDVKGKKKADLVSMLTAYSRNSSPCSESEEDEECGENQWSVSQKMKETSTEEEMTKHFNTFNTSDLKQICKDAGQKTSGTKSSLVESLVKVLYSPPVEVDSEYSKDRLVDLQKKCRERGLGVGGKKEELVARLKASPQKVDSGNSDYTEKKLSDLKELCKERGLDAAGRKDILIARLTAGPSVLAAVSQGLRITARKNEHGNFQVADTDFLVEKDTKKIYGKQIGNSVEPLNSEDEEECLKNGWAYTSVESPKEPVQIERDDEIEEEIEDALDDD